MIPKSKQFTLTEKINILIYHYSIGSRYSSKTGDYVLEPDKKFTVNIKYLYTYMSPRSKYMYLISDKPDTIISRNMIKMPYIHITDFHIEKHVADVIMMCTDKEYMSYILDMVVETWRKMVHRFYPEHVLCHS